MDREDTLAELVAAAQATGHVSDRAHELLGELAGEMADDPRNVDEPERCYRTVLVVELLSVFAPYEGGLADLGRQIAAEEVRAAVLTEVTEEVDDPTEYEAAKPVLVRAYRALDKAGRAALRERFERDARMAARVPAAMFLADAAEAIRVVWPDAWAVVIDVEPWNHGYTSIHAVQGKGGGVIWARGHGSVNQRLTDDEEDWVADSAHDLAQIVRDARECSPDILSPLILDHRYLMRVDEWLRPDDEITEPVGDAPAEQVVFLPGPDGQGGP